MDETLDELGDRLHPRHLLDDLIDLFRHSDSGPRGRQVADMCRSAGKSTARTAQEHPVPALLIGAGVAWWLFDQYTDDDHAEWEELEHGGGHHYVSGGQVPSDYETSYEQEWRQESMPWRDTYRWDEDSEEAWSDRSQRTLGKVNKKLSDSSLSDEDKLKHAAGELISLSGHRRREIHSRWASLREQSGSYVDARTGEPYDASYGQDWKDLVTLDAVASSQVKMDDESIAQQSKAALEELQESLSGAGGSVKDAMRSAVSVLGNYGRSTGHSLEAVGSSVASIAGNWASATARQLNAAGRGTGRAARSVGNSTHRGAVRAQEKLARSYVTISESTAETVDEYPLAVGAACLGLGLLGGLLLPRTRYEDELMGETADDMRAAARAAGEEAYEAGKEVASATAASAMEEARRQGLGPEQLADEAREKASEARNAVKSTAEESDSAVSDVAGKVRSVADEAAETARQQSKKKAEQITS